MEPSPWEAGSSSSAAWEFPNISWNKKIHYYATKSPPLVYIQSQINPVHNPILFL
jgi:hypothetical protein